MFGRIAPRYDLLNRLMTAGQDRAWRSAAIACLAPLSRPGRYLDLATGTGDLALALHARADQENNADVHIDAIDVSAPMLERAKQKIVQRNAQSHIALRTGAAEEIPFPDATFDGVTVGFGVRNFADRRRGLQEILRVLKPGGRLIVLEACPCENAIQRFVQWAHTAVSVRLLGALLSERSAYEYLGNSITDFPNPAAFSQELTDHGFRVEEARSLGLGAVTLFHASR